jgi:predicted O-methyltransferase YrrM
MIGNAVELIPTLKKQYDLVFIDADKENYAVYYDLVFDKLNTGGYIIVDNVLWSGKVLHKPKPEDIDTRAIIDFNKKVQNDSRVQNVLFSIRDGLMVVRKKN